MSKYIWVGLDVHLDSITAAILEHDTQEPEVVTLSGGLMKVRRLFRRLSKKGPVRACYEASGSGFVLQRVLILTPTTINFDDAAVAGKKSPGLGFVPRVDSRASDFLARTGAHFGVPS